MLYLGLFGEEERGMETNQERTGDGELDRHGEDLRALVEDDVERERCEKDLIFLVEEDVEVEDHGCFHCYDMWGDRRI